MEWSQDHHLPGSHCFLSMHRAALMCAWSTHAASGPRDLGSAWRRQRWRPGCFCCQNCLIWFLTSPQHGTWGMTPLNQTRTRQLCLMSSIVSTHTEARYILSHTDKEEDYREGICLLHGFCKLFLNTSNAFCQNNAI